MPGAPSSWIDNWAPPQYIFGNTGGAGPVRSPGGDDVNQSSQSTYDATLHYKLAGVIIGALLLVFTLQQLGFRFVVAAGVGR